MTSLIYLPCKGGCILISDRLEIDLTGVAYEVDKIFVSKNCDFAIAGAFSSSIIERFFAKIKRDASINGNNIDQKFEDIMTEILSFEKKLTPEKTEEAQFIIIASKDGKITPFYGRVSAGQPYISEKSKDIPFCVGYGESLLTYLVKDRNYQTLALYEAIPYSIALMKEVSDMFPFVGGLEKYGFGIVAYSNDSNVFIYRDYRKKAASINVSFQINKFDLSEFEVKKTQG